MLTGGFDQVSPDFTTGERITVKIQIPEPFQQVGLLVLRQGDNVAKGSSGAHLCTDDTYDNARIGAR